MNWSGNAPWQVFNAEEHVDTVLLLIRLEQVITVITPMYRAEAVVEAWPWRLIQPHK